MTKRPVLVTVIALLYFVGTATYGVLAVLDLISRNTLISLLNKLSPQGAGPAPVLLKMEPLLWLYFAVMAVVVGLLGYGMWTLRNWARVITIVLTAVSLVYGLATLARLASGIDVSTLVSTLFRLGLCVLMLWYMWRPGVRAAFRSTDIAAGSNSRIGGEIHERG